MTATADSALALEVFELRCLARARLWREGAFELSVAVDELQYAAVRAGLLDALGQDEVQAIMAAAFADPPELDLVPDVFKEPEVRRAVADSVLMAAEYLIQQNDPERLQRWLAGCSVSERADILDHLERKEARS
jgi:hypothetical protein